MLKALRTTRNDTVRSLIFASLAENYLQRNQFDSTIRAARAGTDASEKAGSYAAMARNLIAMSAAYMSLRQNDPAATPSLKATVMAKKAGDPELQTDAWINRGRYFRAAAQNQYALKALENAINFSKKASTSRKTAQAQLAKAELLVKMNKKADALKAYELALQSAERANDVKLKTAALISAGMLYRKASSPTRAAENYERVITMLDSCRCLPDLQIEALSYLGSLKLMFGDTAKSMKYHRKALQLARKNRTANQLAFAYHGIGDFYLRIMKYDSAEYFLNKAEPLAQKTGRYDLYNSTINAKVSLYTATREYDKALASAKKGQKAASLSNELDLILSAQENQFKVDSSEGNYLAAMQYQKRIFNLRDSAQREQAKIEVEALKERIRQSEKMAALQKQSLEKEAEVNRRNWFLGSFLGLFFLLGALAWSLYRGRQKAKRAHNELKTLYEQVQIQKTEIETQNSEITAINNTLHSTLEELSKQRHALEVQHIKIEDSIQYASRIQRAILPHDKLLEQHLPLHYIFYKPRDIVSGDFYWMTRIEGRTFLAAVDCTGHGVPGAFMSVLGYNLLHQIVDENGIDRADVILATLDRRISRILQQQYSNESTTESSKDGMDVALIVLHDRQPDGSRTVDFAGAGRPLWHFSKGEFQEIKSARYPCGGSQHEEKVFPSHSLSVQTGDRLYLFSDGVTDQFGGKLGRKLGSKNLQNYLRETRNQPVNEQGRQFAAFFEEWMSNRKQIDDVLMVSIEIDAN